MVININDYMKTKCENGKARLKHMTPLFANLSHLWCLRGVLTSQPSHFFYLHYFQWAIISKLQERFVWNALCMAYCCDKGVPGLFMVPYCHYYHCKYNLTSFFLTKGVTVNKQGLLVCPKRLTGSCFTENGFDCNKILIEFGIGLGK